MRQDDVALSAGLAYASRLPRRMVANITSGNPRSVRHVIVPPHSTFGWQSRAGAQREPSRKSETKVPAHSPKLWIRTPHHARPVWATSIICQKANPCSGCRTRRRDASIACTEPSPTTAATVPSAPKWPRPDAAILRPVAAALPGRRWESAAVCSW